MHVVLNLDKPEGITSQDAVIRVKRLLGAKKAGHAGTLDPLATGVLLVCLGEATKITRFLTDLPKEYATTLKLGERTDTFDAEGKIIEKKEGFSVTGPQVEQVLEKFRGRIKQTPPMYSAIKVSGKPLYKLARKGITVERPMREVDIYELSMLELAPPFLKLRVSCSKGTYIRSLAEDIGLALGVGAHVAQLRRTGIGDFRVEEAARLEQLPGMQSAFLSIDSSLRHLREVVLSAGEFLLASHGRAVAIKGGFHNGEYLRLKDPAGKLFALGVASPEQIKMERLLHL